MSEIHTADDAIAAIESGKQVVVTGDAKYGKIRLTPGAGEYFACWFVPERRWSETQQNYKVVETSLGPQDRDEIRSYAQDCLDHSEITLESKPMPTESRR